MNQIINPDKIGKICKRNDISFVGLFGSFVRGEHRKDSDVDLLVRFSKKKSLFDLVRTEREFSEALGRKVDLLTEGAISPYLIDRIKKDVKVIYPAQE